ncbi:MAG: VWA-like domain-containing protein [Actinomycetota bacterium]|nr:VWA-like domain-containing protein [Actinomycetota bacterium]
MSAQERLSAAKLWLTAPNGGNAPYLSAALFAAPVVLTDGVETISADDRWQVYANPDWVLGVEVPVLGAHLEHLLWHLLRDHADRARSMGVGRAESKTWTKAADLTVAENLFVSGHDRVGLALPKEVRLPPELAAEEYFTLLNRLRVTEIEVTDEGSCGSAADGVRRGYEVISGDDDTLDRVRAEELRRLVAIEFREHIKERGTLKGEWARWVDQVLEPKVPWQQVLASSIRRAVAWTQGNTHPTYRRLSRRQAATPRAILPGTQRPVPAVAIIVDTSGSMDDGLLAQALGEVDGVLRSLGGAVGAVDVLSCDADVGAISKVSMARRIELVGGGGTDMRVGIKAAQLLRPRPEVVIVLTDGYTPWPDVPLPGCAVVAVLLHRDGYSTPPAWITAVEVAL